MTPSYSPVPTGPGSGGPPDHPSLGGTAPQLPARRKRSVLTTVTMVLLGLGSLLVALLVLLSGGPVGAVITTVLAAVSFPLLILMCFWLDRYEPEPGRYRIAALGWGGTAAVLIGAGLSGLLGWLTGSSETVTAVVWAPVTEEFAKGLFLVLIIWLRRHQLHGILDGIVYAALAGIGFAFTEDILYYLGALAEGGIAGLGGTFILRGIISPFAHPLFTAAIGVGIGIAVMTSSAAVRVLAPIGGYVTAVLLHAIWNGSATLGGGEAFFVAYAVVMLPALVLVIVVGVWARRKEGTMLAGALTDCARLGWLRPAEIRWVATMADRVNARRHAARVGGKPAVRALRDYQQALTEMGFLHSRVLQGSPPVDAGPRMAEIQQRAGALRPYVILPPDPGSPPPPALQNWSQTTR